MKYCIHCGEPNSDENNVCSKCQKPFPNVEEQSVQNNNVSMQPQHNLASFPIQTVPIYSAQQPTASTSKRKKSRLGIFSGILSIICGLGTIVLTQLYLPRTFYSTLIASKTYGADFYTYTSEQLAGIGYIIGDFGYMVSRGFVFLLCAFGAFLIVLGLFIIAYFKQKAREK